ncbi:MULTISPECIES: metal-sulfur cluster assembly factor [Globicatella]|uniref:Metal-sulfur cluster assembly factor n=1 Tax=Globicatella sulfidifaciens TaxID=136093 RepID=A0A7X8C3T9_9LACT|nr:MULTISPECIES: metal-sulfur cluster assembly factor [Globicatella]NLJ18496.1 metal-sulfur cluster assembly factor [Globicatella sulfidifaciens]WPC08411.1 metal-sulfur cluster assembly factor [Globicatella sp. PHS-GS-PNBC-21-1553]HJF17509.1 metal-sulfur cluster assembly factor [Globicatella sulfidifaciens]
MNEETQAAVMAALETVIDPELGIDLVNLGLIYNVEVNNEGVCAIDMTLTTMGCPLADVIVTDVRNAVLKVDGISDVMIEFVWYPAWGPERMSRYAKIALGMPF